VRVEASTPIAEYSLEQTAEDTIVMIQRRYGPEYPGVDLVEHMTRAEANSFLFNLSGYIDKVEF